MNYVKLSKEISYALRHNPKAYNLNLDEEGYVSIENLLEALNSRNYFKQKITKEDIFKVIEISDKKRLEIKETNIRALYGHTLIEKIKKNSSIPPAILYHGTSHQALEIILKEGLQSMKRQYVHLSVDKNTAYIVGKRKDTSPIILIINTQKAMESGTNFYIGNDKVWLSDAILPDAITLD